MNPLAVAGDRSIPDNEKFCFPTGSAQLSEPFRQYIWVD